MDYIPFNRPPQLGTELDYIADALRRGVISGGGYYTKSCEQWLEQRLQTARALLTHSCTAALEMAALLAKLEPDDEVIMPSFTFVSMGNAVVLRGGVPVFVDIRPDTLNLDETLVEAAITPRTRAVSVVHYAGVCAEMDSITEIAARHSLLVIEDAAHALMSTYRGRLAGTLGDFACLSFHETKNVVSGEGGALIIRRPEDVKRAEIIRDKGTNRAQFERGNLDKYSWVDLGSSYVPSDILAAYLRVQLDAIDQLTADRIANWNHYHSIFAEAEERGLLRRPVVPDHCRHNGHLYYLLLPEVRLRDRLIDALRRDGIETVFHYVPLHSSEGGRRYGRPMSNLSVTNDVSARLLRLPLWYGMGDMVHRVGEATLKRI